MSKAAVQRRRHFFPGDEDGGPQFVRIGKPPSWAMRLVQLTDGRAIVQAGVQIDIGYEVFLPNPGAPGFTEAPKIVASIDRIVRAATKEWLISWDGSRTIVPADTPLVQAQLAPEWFAQPLLHCHPADALSPSWPPGTLK